MSSSVWTAGEADKPRGKGGCAAPIATNFFRSAVCAAKNARAHDPKNLNFLKMPYMNVFFEYVWDNLPPSKHTRISVTFSNCHDRIQIQTMGNQSSTTYTAEQKAAIKVHTTPRQRNSTLFLRF
jgi:hypothetical protein